MTAAAPLQPLHCDHCGAPVPLVDQAEHPCPYCETVVVTPPDYREAVIMRRDTVAARQAAEPKWRKLAAGSSPWWRYVGGTLMTLLPPVATGYGFALEPALTMTVIFSSLTLPALFPGSIVFVWGVTGDATRASYQGALAAQPPAKKGDPPGCRSCGAPLAVGANDLSATCLYCGTDSFLSQVPLATISAKLSEAMVTLDEATSKLRMRLWWVRLALLGIATLLVGLAYALWWAQQQLL